MVANRSRDSSDRIRIAHVVQNLGIGGLEKIVLALMTRTDPDSFWPSAFCLGDGGELFEEIRNRGFDATAFGKAEGIDYRLPFRLARQIRRRRVDIVHCHNLAGLVYGAPAARMGRATGVVYTAHGPSFPMQWKQRLFQRLPLADRVVGVSDHVSRSAVADIGIDERRVVTIKNGVDAAEFGSRSTDAVLEKKAEIGIESDSEVIGVVARLSAEKDHNTLLEAFGLVSRGRQVARLVVVGDGEKLNELRARSNELGVADRVVFLGSRRDIPELLAIFDVFALSSSAEGLGITLLEAMMAGVPVVATEVGGIPEIVDDGITGVLVPPGNPRALADGIERVLNNPAEGTAMAQEAQRYVNRHYAMDEMVRKYEDLYREVLTKR